MPRAITHSLFLLSSKRRTHKIVIICTKHCRVFLYYAMPVCVCVWQFWYPFVTTHQHWHSQPETASINKRTIKQNFHFLHFILCVHIIRFHRLNVWRTDERTQKHTHDIFLFIFFTHFQFITHSLTAARALTSKCACVIHFGALIIYTYECRTLASCACMLLHWCCQCPLVGWTESLPYMYFKLDEARNSIFLSLFLSVCKVWPSKFSGDLRSNYISGQVQDSFGQSFMHRLAFCPCCVQCARVSNYLYV